MSQRDYDITLFRELNREYRDRPLVPRPPNKSASSLEQVAASRARRFDDRIDLRGARVLEIGSGRGHLGKVLAERYGCEVVGVDIVEYETWADMASVDGLDLRVHDITTADNEPLGTFDRILSVAVFEHVERPIEGLEAVANMLRPGGRAYISANLYRGPKASHRYREVYFPFPHLLFDDSVFAEFYEPTTKPHTGPAWVNKLTASQYREQVARFGLDIEHEWFDRTPLDEAFYERFSDKLGKYPREDLELDFIHMVLSPSDSSAPSNAAGARTAIEHQARRVVRRAKRLIEDRR